MKKITALLLVTALCLAAVFGSAVAAEKTETWRYIHDPAQNPNAMKDIVVNPDAVYGFSPDPESSRLGSYAEYDWTDPVWVAEAQESRREYHKSMESMMDILYRMRDEGATLEEMARAVSTERNVLRLASYQDDPEGLAKLKASNLETYGREEGPTPEELFEKYGSWQTVLQKAFSPNLGMDAACGLYDENYDLYIELGLAEPDPTDQDVNNAGIHLPIVETDPKTPTGIKTTWSCVLFGTYPSAEVVDSTWDAVDHYALQDGDLIRDDELYARLEAANWQDNKAELDGFSYLRVGLDSAPGTGDEREQHYRWEYSRPWHYFRILPLRWRVLDIRENRALLLADRMPDCVPFHNGEEDITWEECTLRSWLNGYGAEANKRGTNYTGSGFIDRAFTAEEQEAILPVLCGNPANRDYGTDSGGDTEDRLFILSNEEVFEGENAGRYGFHASRDYDDPAKRFTSTLYAKCMGAWWSPVDKYAGNSFWFMRTSGYTARSITYICDFGFIYSRGTLATCSDAGVLPAMWIDLDKAEIAADGETLSTQIIHTTDQEEASLPAEEIGNPVTIADDSMPGGMYTIWNAVTIGTYPQTEIREVPGPEEGAETDPELYRRLEEAAEGAGDEVILDDTRYVRLEGRWFRYDPIVWRVLEVADGTALLMADRCLDCVPWNAEYTDVFWEGSGVRGWLNGMKANSGDSPYGKRSFAETAFTEEELRAITMSAVSNNNNYYFGTACGSGTRDRVFLLSEEEVFSSEKADRYGFRPSDEIADPGRRLVPTAYAAARGAWRSENAGTFGNGFWLLRTNGYTQDNVVYVGEKGYLYNRGIPVTCRDAGIVPVIRVRLGTGFMIRVEDISSNHE